MKNLIIAFLLIVVVVLSIALFIPEPGLRHPTTVIMDCVTLTPTSTITPTVTDTPVPPTPTDTPTVTATTPVVIPPTETFTPIPPTATFTPTLTYTATATKTSTPVPPVVVANYYVSPGGNDTSSGSLTSPFKTISKAITLAQPGQTVFVREGTYVEKLTLSRSGTETNPIKFLAYPGEHPVIDGQKRIPTSYTGLVNITGSWIVFDGFEVRNSLYVGISSSGKHNLIAHNFVQYSQKTGIALYGDYGIAEYNVAWRNSALNENGVSATWSTGISASRDPENGLTEYPIIRHNLVYETWGQGIDVYESDHAIVEDNIAHDNFANNFYFSDITNSVMQRNLSYNDPASYVYGHGAQVGILLGDEKCKPCSDNNKIINNISIGGKRNLYWYGGVAPSKTNTLIAGNTLVNSIGISNVQFNSGTYVNVRFVDNIIVQDDTITILLNAGSGVSFSNNLWSRTPGSAYLGSGSIIGNPLFEKIGTQFGPEWYRLMSTSPAIGKGSELPDLSSDYFDVVRNVPPDMGAIEAK